MRRIRPISHEDRLSVVDHLDELRSRLIISALAFVVAWAFTTWQNDLVLEIVNAPLPTDSSTGKQIEPLTLGPAEAFTTTLMNAAYFALIIAAPVMLYELYAFILPAFSPAERRVATPLLILVPVLFITGVVFCYFVVLGPALDFLLNFNATSSTRRSGLATTTRSSPCSCSPWASASRTRRPAGRLPARAHQRREAAPQPALRDRGDRRDCRAAADARPAHAHTRDDPADSALRVEH